MKSKIAPKIYFKTKIRHQFTTSLAFIEIQPPWFRTAQTLLEESQRIHNSNKTLNSTSRIKIKFNRLQNCSIFAHPLTINSLLGWSHTQKVHIIQMKITLNQKILIFLARISILNRAHLPNLIECLKRDLSRWFLRRNELIKI